MPTALDPAMNSTRRQFPPLGRNRDYLLLQGGATVSAIGNGMTGLAFLLLGFALTRSATQAGLTAGCFGIGQLIAMLPAGAIADRCDRRRVMVFTATAGGAALATIPIAATLWHLTFLHLVAVAVIEGAVGCFYEPAERGALKKIVAPEQLGTAVSTAMARSGLGHMAGPPLSGMSYAISPVLPFLLDAISYLVAAGCAGLTRTPLGPGARPERTRVFADVKSGLRWTWHNRAVRDIVLVGMPFNFAITGILTVAVLALQAGGESSRNLGMMQGCIGLSGIVAAIVAGPLVARASIGRVTLGGTIAAVTLGSLMPLSNSIWWVGSLLAGVLFVVMPINAGIGAYQMHITPDALQGRVAAAANLLSIAVVPAASASAGILLTHLGRVEALAAYSVVFTVALVIVVSSKAIRAIPSTGEFTGANASG